MKNTMMKGTVLFVAVFGLSSAGRAFSVAPSTVKGIPPKPGVGVPKTKSMNAEETLDPKTLVGVYYFAGWWKEKPNKWMYNELDWREQYPERVPLLGAYNDQRTLNREILAASQHGVDFFEFLWYYMGHPAELDPHTSHVNDGLKYFLSSPYSDRMKFTVEYVNNEPRFWINSEKNWETACRLWCSYMKRPNYLRIGGRPVFKIHGLGWFIRECGNDPVKAAARIATLRRIAHKMELPNPLIGGGVMAVGVPSPADAAPYDFLTTYTDLPSMPAGNQLYPYADLIGYAKKAWKRYADRSPIDYVPYVPAGWDPRPWHYVNSPSFAMPTLKEWISALRSVKRALDRYPRLGVPLPDGGRQKMFLIYAWNEFGEGGIVAPTQGYDDIKLKGIERVFGHNELSQ
ncbi:MAG: hypothetical protein M1330_01280 [Armatimonadetes bacterium]|nr:hypothetical protein [Armatimonadota bacterium]